MSAIVEIRERIQNTVARIAEYEKASLLPGAPSSLGIAIRSLEKMQAELERDFARLAREDESQICRYRLLPQHGDRPSISAITDAWKGFQTFFASVYAAVAKNNGSTRRSAKAARAEVEFAFGYTFSGSIGVVLTLPTGMDYVKTRDLKETSKIVHEMMKAQSTEGLAAFVETLGVSPVVKLRDWVDAHVAFGAGASLEWDIAGEPKPPLLTQVQEFRLLKQAMSKIEEPVEVERTMAGILEGASTKKRTFEMKLDSGEEISGKFVNAISEEQRAELPRRYSALIRTTTTIKPALEKRDVSHFLVRLLERLPL